MDLYPLRSEPHSPVPGASGTHFRGPMWRSWKAVFTSWQLCAFTQGATNNNAVATRVDQKWTRRSRARDIAPSQSRRAESRNVHSERQTCARRIFLTKALISLRCAPGSFWHSWLCSDPTQLLLDTIKIPSMAWKSGGGKSGAFTPLRCWIQMLSKAGTARLAACSLSRSCAASAQGSM